MGKITQRAGKKYGRLTVLERALRKNSIRAFWICRCTCGNTVTLSSQYLQGSPKPSCGCWPKEVLAITLKKAREHHPVKHGMYGTATYKSWVGMKSRCLDKNYPQYHHYGGRGVKVHPLWIDDFQAFYDFMGERPVGCSLDRIDNDKGYFPGNVRWADNLTQQNNKRNNVFYEYDGRRMTLPQWGRFLDIDSKTLGSRIRKGWTLERALKK